MEKRSYEEIETEMLELRSRLKIVNSDLEILRKHYIEVCDEAQQYSRKILLLKQCVKAMSELMQ